jgi:hypothetical protein
LAPLSAQSCALVNSGLSQGAAGTSHPAGPSISGHGIGLWKYFTNKFNLWLTIGFNLWFNDFIDTPTPMEITMSPAEIAALAEAARRGDAAYAAKQVAA